MTKKINIQKLQFDENQSSHKNSHLSDSFIEEHLPLIYKITNQILASHKIPPSIESADLVSWGVEGLVKAKNNFKENKTSQFGTYAFYRIRGEILDKIRIEWQHKNPSEYGVYRKNLREKMQDFISSEIEEDPTVASSENKLLSLIQQSAMVYTLSTENFEIQSHASGTRNLEIEKIDEDTSFLWQEIKNLEPLEQQFVQFFYVQELKQIDIAKKLNLSKSKISRLHHQVLSKLKRNLEKKGIRSV